MTTLCFNDRAFLKHNITVEEAFLLLLIYREADLEKIEESLIKKGYITANLKHQFSKAWIVTRMGAEALDAAIIDSDKSQESKEVSVRLETLASKLKELFPSGKKDGTSYYWAEGSALIVRRLKLFFKKYKSALNDIFKEEYETLSEEEFNNFIDDKIVKATQQYIRSFNGNYTYMRLLKYFILKEKIGASNEVEGDSQLLSHIENLDQEDTLKNDWDITLR